MPWSEEWIIEVDRKRLHQVLGRIIFNLAQEGLADLERDPILLALEEEFVRLASLPDKPSAVRVFCSISQSREVAYGVEPVATVGPRRNENWRIIKSVPIGDDVPPWTKEWIVPLGQDGMPAKDVLDEVLTELERQKFTPRDIFGIHMALEEALVNAIKSLEKPNALRAVCRIAAGCVELSIELLFPPPPSAPWSQP